MMNRFFCATALPWMGGSRIISLALVKDYLARNLVQLSAAILKLSAIGSASLSEKVSALKRYAAVIEREASFLGLTMTAVSAARLSSALDRRESEQKDPDEKMRRLYQLLGDSQLRMNWRRFISSISALNSRSYSTIHNHLVKMSLSNFRPLNLISRKLRGA